jgi:hypothetical protein
LLHTLAVWDAIQDASCCPPWFAARYLLRKLELLQSRTLSALGNGHQFSGFLGLRDPSQ